MSGPFVFRVSDVVEVPYRGHLLRLRLLEGEPDVRDVAPGRWLRLRDPGGTARDVRILDLGVVGGRATQRRLERTRELDILIPDQDARAAGAIRIGWRAEGPVDGPERRAA